MTSFSLRNVHHINMLGHQSTLSTRVYASYLVICSLIPKLSTYLFTKLLIVGCSVLLFMVLCNFTVTRIVHRSYRNMEQLTISCLNDRINSNRQNPIKLCLEGSAISSERDTSNSTSFVTRDEIKFINLCNYLTASFVICWGIQLVSFSLSLHQYFKHEFQNFNLIEH